MKPTYFCYLSRSFSRSSFWEGWLLSLDSFGRERDSKINVLTQKWETSRVARRGLLSVSYRTCDYCVITKSRDEAQHCTNNIKVVSGRLGCIWSDYWAGKHHTDLATLLSGKKTKHHLTFERDGAMTEQNQRTRGSFQATIPVHTFDTRI